MVEKSVVIVNGEIKSYKMRYIPEKKRITHKGDWIPETCSKEIMAAYEDSKLQYI